MAGSDNGRRRVVISGVGMVTPLGNDTQSTWNALVAGESGANEITHFDTSNYDVHFACELKDFEPTVWIDRKQARRMSFAGPRVVAQTTREKLPDDFGRAESNFRFGHLDAIVSRADLRPTLGRLLRLFP